MTWSAADFLDQKKNAFRFLLDCNNGQFARSLDWQPQSPSGVPEGVWSLLRDQDFVDCYDVGSNVYGKRWRLTLPGWIETCSLLKDEIGLDARFGLLSAHLKGLAGGRIGAYADLSSIEQTTGISEQWLDDAIQGQMAEKIYGRHGGTLFGSTVEIPAHIGNKIDPKVRHVQFIKSEWPSLRWAILDTVTQEIRSYLIKGPWPTLPRMHFAVGWMCASYASCRHAICGRRRRPSEGRQQQKLQEQQSEAA